MTVRAVRPGETICVPDADGTEHPWMVFGKCEHRALGYYCNDCRSHIANANNLVFHLEKPGDHSIASWCGNEGCRLYRSVEQAQLDALTPQQAPL